MGLKVLFARRKPLTSTAFSEFIRNASSAEKAKVYTEVMKTASERQNSILASGKLLSSESQ